MISFNEEQYRLIMEAVEDYGMLVDEEISFKCEEINAIIQAHLDQLQPLNCPFTVSTIIMTDKEMETAAQEFWENVEKEAAELEVTVDYFLAEFYCP